MKLIPSFTICFVVFLLTCSVASHAQTIDSVRFERSTVTQEEGLIKKRNKLNKASRLFTILTISLVGGSVVADKQDNHAGRCLVIWGLTSATLALVTAIKANKIDKEIRQLHQR